MEKSTTKLHDALRELHHERRRLIRHLTARHELAIGSVSVVYRKCGNPRCHCADGVGHQQTLFAFKDIAQGRRRCKLVRRADESRMLRAGKRYRQFREDLKRLRAIDREEKQILMAIAEQRAVHYE